MEDLDFMVRGGSDFGAEGLGLRLKAHGRTL